VAGPASSASRSNEVSGEASPQASAPTSAAKATAEVIVVTQGDDFLLELGESFGGATAVRPVETLALALEQLAAARRTTVLVIDARELPDLRGDIDRAQAHSPTVPTLVFSPAESEKGVAAALKGSNVFAVLSIPVDRRKTAAVFEGAVADATARRASARPAPNAGEIRLDVRAAIAPEPMAPPVPAASAARPPGKILIGAAAAGVVAVLAGVAVWWFGRATPKAPVAAAAPVHATAPEPARPAVPADAPLAQGTVDELLEKARGAMRERRYTEPANDSALLYYRSALKVDPNNGEAHDGMTRLAGLLMSRFEDSLTAGRFDDASGALAGLKVSSPGDVRLGPLEWRLTQLEVNKALTDGNLDRVSALIHQAQQSNVVPADQLAKWRAEVARRQDDAKLKRLSDAFGERLRDGHLLDPENDSAKYYLGQLKELAPTSQAVQHASRDLISAFLKKGREAALANHSSDADRWLGEAKAAGMSAAEVTAYQKDLSTARARAAAAEAERLAQLAHERMRDGRLTDPSQDSANFYATQLKDGYADNPAVATVSHDLAAKLLERAGSAARAGQPALIDSDLALARRWGADPADVQAVQQTVAARAKNASGQNRPAAVLPPGVKLKRTRYEPPEYPQKAIDAKLAGSVTVEFTVGLNGQPHDIHVIESTPANIFDHAAVSAVSHWRFEPVVINNVPTEVPTRTAIRFELPK
jgi:TonB family protein